jgi:hypothetical protein
VATIAAGAAARRSLLRSIEVVVASGHNPTTLPATLD